MSEECDCPPCEKGLPPWLATFADLMALLMCFFVLLLSFAEMDVLKFKQVAGALKLAFGVQRDVKATEIPRGTSVIAQNYSPGKPTEVTPLEIMREKTTDDTKTNLDYTDTTSRNDQNRSSAMSEDCDCPPCKEGLPPWLATFADLMALLMCFFVLLLSFAEMDVLKFKQVAGALKLAFGVQRDVKATEIPRGTSVIAQNYSPGKPTEVTPLEIMREKTTDDTKTNLDYTDSTSRNDQSLSEDQAEDLAQQKAQREAKEEAEDLQEELAAAIGDGLLEVEAFNDRVLIRIRERGSFSSGQAKLKPEFLPILKLIAEVLKQRDGHFIIAGHTDDIPIETRQFRSNWELSAGRAASVVHYFIQEGDIDPERMEIRALADNEPLVPNDSWENRAQNRRVEISVLHGNRQPIKIDEPAHNVDFVEDPQ